MNKTKYQFPSFLLAALLLFVSCSRDNNPPFEEDQGPIIDDRFLISKVYDHQNRILGEYEYGNRNQIKTMILYFYGAEPQRKEYEFKYDPNGVLSRFVENIYTGTNSGSSTVDIRYNEQGNVMSTKRSTHALSRYYYYSSDGRYLCNSNKSDGVCPANSSALTYDAAGNVVQRIDYMTGDMMGGGVKENINVFTYDNKNKPSIGLDKLWFLPIFPYLNTIGINVNPSKNNQLTYEMVGYPSSYKWLYTYDVHDRPVTIETISEFQPNLTADIMHIEYKK